MWANLHHILSQMFHELNDGQPLESPQKLWQRYQHEIRAILDNPDVDDEAVMAVKRHLVEIGPDIWIPQSYEAVRVLQQLKQRFSADAEDPNPLVAQLRVEALIRRRPVRDILRSSLEEGKISRILADIGQKHKYSRFQVDGWRRILEAIGVLKHDNAPESVVVVAPTGSGKTEVFLLPVIYHIASKLNSNDVPRYIMIYPRVELLKDQVSRNLKYAYRAEQQFTDGQQSTFNGHRQAKHPFVVGIQFGGVRSTYQGTFKERSLFDEQKYFLLVPTCPICEDNMREGNEQCGRLKAGRANGRVIPLECDNLSCGAVFHVTIGKNDHAEARIKPHILVTTMESLDRLYLNPKLESYIRNIQGILLDEVHLFHSLYGAHIYNLIRRIEAFQEHGQPLSKIAASATVSNPGRFISRLFYGVDEDSRVEVLDAEHSHYDLEDAGLETVVFLQTTETESFSRTQSTLLQTIMAVGHSVLGADERAIVFTESIDHANRTYRQLLDEENEKRLWQFRMAVNDIKYNDATCPATSPLECDHIYAKGECWRAIRGGVQCHTNLIEPFIINRPLNVDVITSQDRGNYWDPDVIVATPVLEVGVDDERFKATIHYRPPQSVFSFLQRRGRAGRSAGDTAYSILVLGRTPSDEFYFRRRNRLMDPGNFELPLNPRNVIIQSMHDQLEIERETIGTYVNQMGNLSKAIFRWMIEKYLRCQTLSRVFGEKLTELQNSVLRQDSDHQTLQQDFTQWIRDQHDRFKRHLDLDLLLDELTSRVPVDQRGNVTRFSEMIYAYRNKEGVDIEEIKQLGKQIAMALESIIFDTEEELEQEKYKLLQNLIRKITKDHQSIEQLDIEADQRLISALYDYFNLLKARIVDERYPGTLNRAEDMVKIVLQSLFYIGNACLSRHSHCESCTRYFVPDAYFQEVKPIIVETWTNRGKNLQAEIHVEDTTKLANMLLPYKTFYRYFSDQDAMAVLRTTTSADWVSHVRNQTIVRLEPGIVGVQRKVSDEITGIEPNKIHVVPIRPDKEGQGVVGLCLNCYALHRASYNGTCSTCGNTEITKVRLRSEAIVRRQALFKNALQISDTFWYCHDLTGHVQIDGANVRYIRQWFDGEQFKSVGGDPQEFTALYYRNGEVPYPIVYDLVTHGIAWDLSNVISHILGDEQLRETISHYPDKNFDAELILHTASHMLHKAIASISGVNDITLEYAIQRSGIDGRERAMVVVWERYEGGVGISEIIRDTLQEDPILFYRELLASALCPVFYAEDTQWPGTDESLRRILSERWALDGEDILIDGIIREVKAERGAIVARQAEASQACSEDDGCPACVHVTVCTEHIEQPHKVSRFVAEAIMDYFRLTVDNTRLEAMNRYRRETHGSEAFQLRHNLEEDVYDIVRF
ncbi:MAG: DEAD/DEAH box helicase [Aggregatilineales bacterium]